MKRIFSLIFLTLLLSFMVLGQSAKEGIIEDVLPEFITHIPGEESDASLMSEDIYDVLTEALLDYKSSIDVRDFRVPVSEYKIYGQIIKNLILSDYRLHYIDSAYSVRYSSGYVTQFIPTYLSEDKEKNDAETEKIRERIDEYLTYVSDDMNDIQKLMTLHDRIILECEYDTSYDHSYYSTHKGIFLNNTAVCSGYSSALNILASMVGIEGGFLHSDDMNHLWNCFYIDGELYHVDVTWDDPIPDQYGFVFHDHFLKSNDWITSSEGGHYGFEEIDAASTRFDDAFWHDVDSPIIINDGDYYYCDKAEKAILKTNDDFEETQTIYTFNNRWYADPEHIYHWSGIYSGLAFYNNRLYFNTNDSIMSCELNGSDVKSLYTIDQSEDCAIYSLFGKKNELYYSTYSTDYPSIVNGELEENVYELPLLDIETDHGEVICSGNCGASSEDHLIWFLYEDGTLVIKGSGDMLSSCFEYNSLIEYVIIENGVKCISDYAFSHCNNLTKIEIGSGVTSIGYAAFSGCSSLTDITIPDRVTSLSVGAFSGCTSLTDIAIPDSVASIGIQAFYNCSSLTDIAIPDSVTSIGDGAFYNCSSLENATIFSRDVTFDNDVFNNCPRLTIYGYSGSSAQAYAGEYDIPFIPLDDVEEYTPGDINGDGVVSNRDAARLMQYLAGWDVEYLEQALDVTGDGIVNNRDAARIMQYLAGWNVILN